MDYRKKYLKYKKKYNNTKYGGTEETPLQPPIPYNESLNIEDYQNTMNLFYELSQLNLKAEQLHNEILLVGLPFKLNYEYWTWTNADNDQFADMNLGEQKALKSDRHRNPLRGDPYKIIKKSKVTFSFFTLMSTENTEYSTYWLNRPRKDTELSFVKWSEHFEEFFDFIEKIKKYNEEVNVFLNNYDIDISRSYSELQTSESNSNRHLFGSDNDEKIHIYPIYVYSDTRYWNTTQKEWLRKLNNFFMYERKKDLYKDYCNLRLCDARDFADE